VKSKRVVIIGGGLGGLSAALRLAAAGWRVTVCEQGATFGGKMNSWEKGGFRFDTGPSLITMPWVFEEVFEVAGSRLQDHLELIRMEPLADYRFADGTGFTYSSSLSEWLPTIRQLDGRDVDGFLRFIELGARLYQVSNATFLRRRPFDPPDRTAFPALKQMPLRYGWGNYHKTVAAHFHSPYLVQLFDRYPTYVGSSPYESPATLAVIPYIEYAFGGWYVKGGLYRIVESFLGLARQAGVELLAGARVERIEREGRRVKGVVLADNRRLAAEVLVMNGEASEVARLMGDERARLPERERSMSGFALLLGVNRTLHDVRHHSIYFSADYENEFSQLCGERRFPDDPTVYVNVPSRSDRSTVPGTGETLFVMANAPANDRDEWGEAETEEARRRVLGRLKKSGFPDIEPNITVSEVWTPRKLAGRYLMPGGAIYGTHSHGWKHAFLRPPNKDRRYEGLYYVGGSTHPGGGTPTVLLSAKITSELINRFEKSK
jgi:phytoene desaturase